jgi:hypothetical protein
MSLFFPSLFFLFFPLAIRSWASLPIQVRAFFLAANPTAAHAA